MAIVITLVSLQPGGGATSFAGFSPTGRRENLGSRLGEGYSTTSPGVQRLCSRYTLYGREGILAFRMPSIGKWYPLSHTDSLELCIPINCCRYAVFKT